MTSAIKKKTPILAPKFSLEINKPELKKNSAYNLYEKLFD